MEHDLSLGRSRDGISKALGQILPNQAVEDDKQYTIAQVMSDAEQARRRAMNARAKCDFLARHPWNSHVVGAGVLWGDLDGKQMAAACENALRQDALDKAVKLRVTYEVGRAYDKVNDERWLDLMRKASLKLSCAATFSHLLSFTKMVSLRPKTLDRLSIFSHGKTNSITKLVGQLNPQKVSKAGRADALV